MIKDRHLREIMRKVDFEFNMGCETCRENRNKITPFTERIQELIIDNKAIKKRFEEINKRIDKLAEDKLK